MIDEVLLFLDGRADEVVRRVRERMAAGRRVARLRARGRAARRAARTSSGWRSRPSCCEVEGGDRDVIGYARDGDDACVALLRIRGGKLLAREHQFLENIEGEDDAAVLVGLSRRHVSCRCEERARELLVPFDFEDRELLEESLERHARSTCRSADRGASWSTSRSRTRGTCSRSSSSPSLESRGARGDPGVRAAARARAAEASRARSSASTSRTRRAPTPSASCVWFENGRPQRAEYRKFKVKTVEGTDDFASMREVVGRYFQRRLEEEKPLPDLVVIDGGKGQLNAAREALDGARPRRRCRSSASPSARRRSSCSAAPSRCGCRAARRRCACCSRRATRRTASRSRTSGSGARCARSRRSCCGFPASATSKRRLLLHDVRQPAGRSRGDARGDRRAARLLGARAAQRILDALRASTRRAADRHRARPRRRSTPIRIRDEPTWHLDVLGVRSHAQAGDARASVCPDVRPAASRALRLAVAVARRASRRAGTCGATRRAAARRRRGAGLARRGRDAAARGARARARRSASRGCGSRTKGCNPTASFKARGMSAAVTRARGARRAGPRRADGGQRRRGARRVRRGRGHAGARLRARARTPPPILDDDPRARRGAAARRRPHRRRGQGVRARSPPRAATSTCPRCASRTASRGRRRWGSSSPSSSAGGCRRTSSIRPAAGRA